MLVAEDGVEVSPRAWHYLRAGILCWSSSYALVGTWCIQSRPHGLILVEQPVLTARSVLCPDVRVR